MKRNLICFTLLCLLWSCSDQKIDTAKAKAEMEAREIKKVSEADIVNMAMEQGRSLIASYQLIKDEGSEEYTISSSLNDTSLPPVEHYWLNKENNLKGKAKGIFEAYQYNLDNGIKSEDIVQKLEDGDNFLYTSPSNLGGQLVGVWAITFSRKELVMKVKN